MGILSQRDALLVETLRDVDPAKVPVEDAMTSDVYLVSPDTPLLESGLRRWPTTSTGAPSS